MQSRSGPAAAAESQQADVLPKHASHEHTGMQSQTAAAACSVAAAIAVASSIDGCWRLEAVAGMGWRTQDHAATASSVYA